jgi:hypothetical protein
MASGAGDQWQIRLDAAAEVYVASLRSAGVVVSLPRFGKNDEASIGRQPQGNFCCSEYGILAAANAL